MVHADIISSPQISSGQFGGQNKLSFHYEIVLETVPHVKFDLDNRPLPRGS